MPLFMSFNSVNQSLESSQFNRKYYNFGIKYISFRLSQTVWNQLVVCDEVIFLSVA